MFEKALRLLKTGVPFKKDCSKETNKLYSSTISAPNVNDVKIPIWSVTELVPRMYAL